MFHWYQNTLFSFFLYRSFSNSFMQLFSFGEINWQEAKTSWEWLAGVGLTKKNKIQILILFYHCHVPPLTSLVLVGFRVWTCAWLLGETPVVGIKISVGFNLLHISSSIEEGLTVSKEKITWRLLSCLLGSHPRNCMTNYWVSFLPVS